MVSLEANSLRISLPFLQGRAGIVAHVQEQSGFDENGFRERRPNNKGRSGKGGEPGQRDGMCRMEVENMMSCLLGPAVSRVPILAGQSDTAHHRLTWGEIGLYFFRHVFRPS